MNIMMLLGHEPPHPIVRSAARKNRESVTAAAQVWDTIPMQGRINSRTVAKATGLTIDQVSRVMSRLLSDGRVVRTGRHGDYMYERARR